MPDEDVGAAKFATELMYLRQTAIDNGLGLLAYLLDMAIAEAIRPTEISPPLADWLKRAKAKKPGHRR